MMMKSVIDSKKQLTQYSASSKILQKFMSQIYFEEQNYTPQISYLISLLKKVRNAISELDHDNELSKCEVNIDGLILRDPNLLSMSLAFNKCLRAKLQNSLEKVVELDVAGFLESAAFGEDVDIVAMIAKMDDLFNSLTHFNKNERKEDPKRLVFKLHKLNGLINTFSIVEDNPVVKIKTKDWDEALYEFSSVLGK